MQNAASAGVSGDVRLELHRSERAAVVSCDRYHREEFASVGINLAVIGRPRIVVERQRQISGDRQPGTGTPLSSTYRHRTARVSVS